jgi:hypothetical protein
MQLECSDESLACSVGLQSTPSSVVRSAVEGRGIVSATNGSAAVEDNGDTCVIATWAASASDSAPGRCLGWRPEAVGFSCAGNRWASPIARAAWRSVGALSTWFPASTAGRNGLRPNRRRAYRGAGIATT